MSDRDADARNDPFEDCLLDGDEYEFEDMCDIEAAVENASGPLDIDDFIITSFE